jgi:ribosomal protein L11 methylase PrmA
VTYPALDLRFAPGPGAGAFQDMLYAELDSFEPVAIQEHETGDGWRVFFRTAPLRDAASAALASEFGNALLDITPQDVDDEDWARRSQAALTSVRVGRIVVAPPWEADGSRDPRLATCDSQDAGAMDPARARRQSPAAIRQPPVANRESPLSNRDSEPAASRQSPAANREQSAASRQPPVANRDLITIVIDPSMGFGTGHHATTRLCLELLQTIGMRGRRAIDVGTGSGVLALAAWKLGASSVSALDNDPDALRNARDNAARNGAAAAIEFVEGDLSSATLQPADIVLANLTSAVIGRHAAALRRLGNEDAVFILSGFGVEQADEIARALGVQARHIVREGEWAAIRLGRA